MNADAPDQQKKTNDLTKLEKKFLANDQKLQISPRPKKTTT